MADFWKNKKIFAYIALSHHTRFMTPVMDTLAARGAIVRYIVGQAERSQEITAIEMGLPYSHIFDFITEKDRGDINANYTRLRNGISASLKQSFIIGTQPITVIDKTLMATATEYVGFKNLVKKEKPDLCFALHELNRWGKIFAFWAKKKNIPFVTLQEGLSYNLSFGYTGHAQYSCYNLVWGPRVKEKLTSFEAPPAKIIPCGNTHLASEIHYQKANNIREKCRKKYRVIPKFVTLLILSSRLPVPDLFFRIFKTVSEQNDLHIVVKFHPATKNDPMDQWIGAVQDHAPNNITFIHAQESTYDLISMADLVVLGQKSTTGLETLALGKPLVKLDFAYTPNAPYSFVDQGVALKMRAEELTTALTGDRNFDTPSDKVTAFLNRELLDSDTAIQNVCQVFEKAIRANRLTFKALPPINCKATKQWSILVQVPRDAQILLAQLEAIHFNSMEGGTYETLLLLPPNLPVDVVEIINSLQGDISHTKISDHPSRIHAMNNALENACGSSLLILSQGLAPLKGWLSHLSQGRNTHKDTKLFSARIADTTGQIAHAGMVVDSNNTPVPAYAHLDINFKAALKERRFQMADHFIAVDRDLFRKAGGLTPDAGDYLFMDFCLKAGTIIKESRPVMFLPDLQMIFLNQEEKKERPDPAIYFYGKWNCLLWENQRELHREDEVSEKDLAHSQMAAALGRVI